MIEQESKPIVLLTAEQEAEIKRLLDVVKIEDDWLPKVLAKAGVESVSELDTDKAAKVIEALTKKVSK